MLANSSAVVAWFAAEDEARGTPSQEDAERILRRVLAIARGDIQRAQSPEIVAFAQETVETVELMLEFVCRA